MNFTNEELIRMVYVLGESERNCTLAARVYRQRYPEARQAQVVTFEKLKNRFEATGSVAYPKKVYENKNVSNEETELNVLLALQQDPNISVREISRDTDISKSSVNRIIKKNKYHPYHLALHQELHGDDFQNRVRFCQIMQEKITETPDFLSSVLFSDEAGFKSNGLVNRHNMHYYATENPHWMREVDNQHVWSLNVWGGILGMEIIGPYFFQDRLNGPEYRNFLSNELPVLLEEVDLITRHQMWLQHDGAPAHYHRIVRDYLTEAFADQWIGRGGPVSFPARSPDLTPLDFFLWGDVKQKVYREKPTTEENMRQRITAAFRSIRRETLRNVQETIPRRFDLCIRQQGGLFEHLI